LIDGYLFDLKLQYNKDDDGRGRETFGGGIQGDQPPTAETVIEPQQLDR
jgi:hypothetical protein